MKKRLRKKKRVGEFQEFGFELKAQLRFDITEAEVDLFIDRFIAAVEARMLCFGGGVLDGSFECFVTYFGRGSATEDDRTELGYFLAYDRDVMHHETGPLIDAWHGGVKKLSAPPSLNP